MANNLFAWISRIKAIEKEHAATITALDRTIQSLRQDPSTLPPALDMRDFLRASASLEGTYIIRLFAEFESALRSFWTVSKKPATLTRHLVGSIAAKRDIPSGVLDNAQKVREYRNGLVHERTSDFPIMTLIQIRSFLCHFLSYLPPSW